MYTVELREACIMCIPAAPFEAHRFDVLRRFDRSRLGRTGVGASMVLFGSGSVLKVTRYKLCQLPSCNQFWDPRSLPGSAG